jgi:hypothetical protein
MKKLVLTCWLLLLGVTVFAQWGDEEMSDKPTFRDRIFTGGGFGLSFSNYYDYVSVSPLIGYRITPKLAGGVGLQYRYTNYKQTIPKISTNDYGSSIFLRYMVYGPIFLHTEYEYLNYQYVLSSGEKTRKGFNSFLAGGGFFQPMGRKAGFYVLALYNFSYKSPYSGEITPYNSPLVVRAGITAGF